MSEEGKIPTLDKGYVQLRCFAPSSGDLEKMISQFRTDITVQILDMVQIYFNVKCPYFLLIPLLSGSIKAKAFPSQPKEAFVPGLNLINSGNLENDMTISKSMEMTIDALMINQKGYVRDGCNSFVASLTTPVAAYWEGIMHGSLSDWLRFCSAKNTHPIVKQYQRSMIDALFIEYKNISEMMDRISR